MQITNLFNGGTLANNKLMEIVIDDFVNPPTIQPTVYSFKIRSSNGYDIVSGALTFTADLETLQSNTI